MIVNSIMLNQNEMEPSTHCENYYLKRKLDEITDSIDNNNSHLYVTSPQIKKRHIQYYSNADNTYQDNLSNIHDDDNHNHHQHHDQHQQNPTEQHETSPQTTNNVMDNCELHFNLNNASFTDDCQSIQFLRYDDTNLVVDSSIIPPLSSSSSNRTTTSSTTTTTSTKQSESTSIIQIQSSVLIPTTRALIAQDSPTTATVGIPTTVYTCADEEFDTTNWENSDLLELDQKYNSVNLSVCFEKDDEDIMQLHLQQHQQNVTEHLTQQQLQDHDLHTIHQQTIHQSRSPHQLKNNHHLISNNPHMECDFEDKNLSWLFNFKLDELPHLSPEVQNSQKNTTNQINQNNNTTINNNNNNNNNNISQNNNNNNMSQNNNVKIQKQPQSKTGKKVDELIKEVTADMMADDNDSIMVVAENIVAESTTRMPKKPPFTYTELIEYALEDKGELTVSGIYQWISDRFPFYKSNDDRWKNSVRHNLSINPHFRKGVKAPQGAGHLWTISSRDSEENALAWEHKKQRLELFFKMEELQIQKHQNQSYHHHQQQHQQQHHLHNNLDNCNNGLIYDEAAIAAASIQQQMCPNANLSPELRLTNHSPLTNTSCLPIENIIQDDILKKAAGDILNGVRRTVEVQPIHSTISTYDNLLESDYLNPITKDDAVSESGLRNEYYVTEIDPIELGINMSNVEEEVLFNDEFNLNYFGITSANDIVA